MPLVSRSPHVILNMAAIALNLVIPLLTKQVYDRFIRMPERTNELRATAVYRPRHHMVITKKIILKVRSKKIDFFHSFNANGIDVVGGKGLRR